MYNALLEQINQVQGNIVRTFNIHQTYVDKNDPWTDILAAAAFAICSTNNRQNGYSSEQLIFGRDIILPIKHRADRELILQQKKTQINRYNTQENKHRVDYEYKVGDKFMLNKYTSYKYETTYKVPLVITQCFTNSTVNLKCSNIQIKYNIRCINPYKSDTKVEDSNKK